MSAPSGSASAPATNGDEPAGRTAEVAAITETITRLVHQVISDDLDADAALELDLDITADSSFSEDIELESIEFVALGEQLQLAYGEKVDLLGWFGDLDLDEIVDLTVGELAEFIAACLAGEVAVPGGAGA